jgi:hypothetical protein
MECSIRRRQVDLATGYILSIKFDMDLISGMWSYCCILWDQRVCVRWTESKSVDRVSSVANHHGVAKPFSVIRVQYLLNQKRVVEGGNAPVARRMEKGKRGVEATTTSTRLTDGSHTEYRSNDWHTLVCFNVLWMVKAWFAAVPTGQARSKCAY